MRFTYGQANFVLDERNLEHKRFAERSNIQAVRYSLQRGFVQKDMQWVQNKFMEWFPFHTREKNHNLGSIYAYARGGATKMEFDYPGYNKFSDEGGRQSKGAWFITLILMFLPSMTDESRPCTCQSVSGGLRLLHLGITNKRAQQDYWNRRKSTRGASQGKSKRSSDRAPLCYL